MSEGLNCLALYLLEAIIENQHKCEGKAKPNEFGLRDVSMLLTDLDPRTDAFTKTAASVSVHTCSSLHFPWHYFHGY